MRLLSVAAVGGGAAAGQALSLLAAPLLTRLYAPEQFGALAFFMACVSFDVVACLCYERGIIIAAETRERRTLVPMCVLLSIVVAAAAVPLAMGLDHVMSRDSDGTTLGQLVVLLPVAIVLSAGMQTATNVHLLRRGYARIGWARFAQSLGATGSQIAFASTFGPLDGAGLIVGHVAGLAIGSLLLVAGSMRSFASAFPALSGPEIVRVASKYASFPAFTGPALLLNMVTIQASTIALGLAFGVREMGVLALCLRVANAPTALITSAVSQVFLAEAAAVLRAGNPGALSSLIRATARLLVAPVAGFVVAAAVAPWVFPILFGSEWQEAGQIFWMVAIPSALQLIAVPIYSLVNVVGRQDMHLKVEAGRLTFMMAAALVVANAPLGFPLAVFVLSAALALGYVVCAWGVYTVVRKR